MVMKKFTNILNRRPSHDDEPIPDGDSPEAVAGRAVRLFCESGGPNNATEEIQYLPDIVTSAESSPAAAAVAASQIREFLSKKHYNRPHVQYNAVMLIRILADNPGATFTRNLDKKFVDTVKELLRNGRDPSVAQILRETLSAMYREKAYDNNLAALFQMWSKEQGQYQPRYTNGHPPGPRSLVAPPWSPSQNNTPAYEGQGNYGSGSQSHSRGIPPPTELAGRIEESRTSAKLLLQLIQSTPSNELLSNDLIKEFAERCQSAQRSIQGYINCDNPPPDHDTMQTLIETSEQLSLAMSKHQRAILNARRQADPTSPPSNPTPPPSAYYSSTPAPAPTSLVLPHAGPPPTTYSRPNSSPSTAYPPTTGPLPSTFSPSTATFSPPPGPPPSLQATLQRGMEPTPQPPHAAIPSEPVELPSAAPGERHENPFADSHAQSYDVEIPAPTEPVGAPPQPPRQGHDERHVPASLQVGAGWQGVSGGSAPYHPGHSSTPSYLHRQESAGEHVTMQGGAMALGRGAGVGGQGGQGGDVSPVESRTVTYRY